MNYKVLIAAVLAAAVVEADELEPIPTWIAVPSANGPRMNGMQDRRLTGYTSWEYRDFVVDIPVGGQWIVIGFYMEGQGQLWVRDLEFEVVPDTVPVNLVFDEIPIAGPNLELE